MSYNKFSSRQGSIMRITVKLLCMLGLTFVLCGTMVNAQDKPKSPIESLSDDNFKKKIAKGFVLVHFTAKYQMKKLDKKLFDGVKGFEGCVIYEVDHSKVKKVVKKLRLRNYPSIALFHNGKKKEVWKADMDGIVDITNKHIKKSISDAMSGDVF